MPKVKTIVAHDNEIGVRDGLAKYHKAVGSVYDVATDAEAKELIEAGVVEDHGSNNARASGASSRA